MQMEAGLDTGPVLFRVQTALEPDETTGQLHDRLSQIGASAITHTLENLDTLTPEPQPAQGVTYAHKIDKAEAAIDWSRPAQDLHRQINGLSPFPGAWFEQGGTRIKVLGASLAQGQGAPGQVLTDDLTVACGLGAIRLTRLQRAGKGVQDAPDFLRGMPLAPGTQLESKG